MTDLIEKIKEMKTSYKLIAGFFVLVVIANMLGYGG